jgi:hypothetical protein
MSRSQGVIAGPDRLVTHGVRLEPYLSLYVVNTQRDSDICAE